MEINGNNELPIERGHLVRAAIGSAAYLIEGGEVAQISKSGTDKQDIRIVGDVNVSIAGHVNSRDGSPSGNSVSVSLYCSLPVPKAEENKLDNMVSNGAVKQEYGSPEREVARDGSLTEGAEEMAAAGQISGG
jgi:hypothetical protein